MEADHLFLIEPSTQNPNIEADSVEHSAQLPEIAKDLMDLLKYGEESVSEAIEEVKPQDWAEKVYKPDILDNLEKLYKKPRYTM